MYLGRLATAVIAVTATFTASSGMAAAIPFLPGENGRFVVRFDDLTGPTSVQFEARVTFTPTCRTSLGAPLEICAQQQLTGNLFTTNQDDLLFPTNSFRNEGIFLTNFPVPGVSGSFVNANDVGLVQLDPLNTTLELVAACCSIQVSGPASDPPTFSVDYLISFSAGTPVVLQGSLVKDIDTEPVPLPATLPLLAAACGGLAMAERRKKRQPKACHNN